MLGGIEMLKQKIEQAKLYSEDFQAHISTLELADMKSKGVSKYYKIFHYFRVLYNGNNIQLLFFLF